MKTLKLLIGLIIFLNFGCAAMELPDSKKSSSQVPTLNQQDPNSQDPGTSSGVLPTPTPQASPTPNPTPTPTPPPSPPPTPPPGSGPKHLEFLLREMDGKSFSHAPVSITYVFEENDFFPGQVSLLQVESNVELPLQVDVLRKNNNGAIRHAMLSFILPSVAAYEVKTFRILKKAPLAATPFQQAYSATDLDARIELTGMNGSPDMVGRLQDVVADPSQCLSSGNVAGDSSYFRFNGPIMKECVTWGKMRHNDGVADAQLDFSYRVRTYSGVDSALVDLVVENSHVKLSPTDTTSVFKDHFFSAGKLVLGKTAPVTAWSYATINVWANTRFRVLQTYQQELFDPEIIYSLEDLVQGRVINMPNTSIPLPYNFIDTDFIKGDETVLFPQPGQWGKLLANMGQAADHWYIGTETRVDKTWAATMNRRALKASIGMHNAIGSMFDVSYRQSASQTSQMPGGPIGINCAASSQSKPTLKNAPGAWDTAHHPDPWMAYTMNGAQYLEESALFVTTWNMQFEQCTKILETRQLAWTLRSIVNGAWIVSDSNPIKSYLEQGLDQWLDVLKTKTIDTTYTDGLMEDAVDGSVALQVSGRPYWINANRLSPWQYSWVCWSLQQISKKGYTKAYPIRDWVCRYSIDSYTAEDDPEQKWTGPDGNIYTFPSLWAMTYELGHELFYTLKPYDPLYQGSCAVTPWQYMVPEPPKRRFVNRGEAWYYTMLNIVHKGYPYADLCPINADQTPASEWTLTNGWSPLGSQSNWHGYGGEAAITAAVEAVLSQTGPTTLDATKVMSAYAKNVAYRMAPAEKSWSGLSLIPVQLN